MKWYQGNKTPKADNEYFLRDYRDNPQESLRTTPFVVDRFIDGQWVHEQYDAVQGAWIVTPHAYQELPWAKIKDYEE